MKKKLVLSLAAAALVGTLAVGGTLAWFTDTETATNVVTVGNVDVLWNEGATEDKPDGTDITGETKGLNLGENQVPGFSYEKNAKIKNVGKNDAYVRAQIWYQFGDDESTLTQVLPDGYTVDILANKEGNKWAANENYYYYMGKVLNKTGETDLLVGTVGIAGTAKQDDIANDDLRVILKAEAIQADYVTEEEPKTLEDYVAIFADKTLDNYESEAAGN